MRNNWKLGTTATLSLVSLFTLAQVLANTWSNECKLSTWWNAPFFTLHNLCEFLHAASATGEIVLAPFFCVWVCLSFSHSPTDRPMDLICRTHRGQDSTLKMHLGSKFIFYSVYFREQALRFIYSNSLWDTAVHWRLFLLINSHGGNSLVLHDHNSTNWVPWEKCMSPDLLKCCPYACYVSL